MLAHHQFGWKRWTTTALAAGAWRRIIDCRGQRREVDMLLQYPQCIAKLVELRFALMIGKQAVFDHRNQVRIGSSTSRQSWGGLSRFPELCRNADGESATTQTVPAILQTNSAELQTGYLIAHRKKVLNQ